METRILRFASSIVLATIPAVVLAGNDVNAFVEGSVWVTEYSSFYSSEIVTETMSIEGDCLINNRNCMELWRSVNGSEKKLYAYLYTDADKVYFMRKEDTTQSFLFYDFGLEADEQAVVMRIDSNMASDDFHYYQTCSTSHEINTSGVPLEVMEMSEHNTMYEGNVDHEWIKGVGSTDGILNNSMKDVVGGMSAKLTQVIVDGVTIYSTNPNQPDAISELSPSQGMIHYYDLQGRRVQNPHNGQMLIKR